MSSINFVNAYWLLLAIPLVVLFAVPFFLAVRRDNVNGHNIASGVMHVVMALLLAFSAAGTNVVTTLTETDVYVLADVSYSSNRNLDQIDDYIAGLAKALPRNSRMGVVCFGKDYKLLNQLDGANARRKSVKSAEVDGSETDLISALEYTASLFRDGIVKRIVVISDGAQTYMDDANALKRTVDKLAAEKIKVDAVFLDNNIKAGVKEIQISSVQVARSVFKGHAKSASVIVQSNEMADAFITLKKDGVQTEERAIKLSKGSNSVSLPLDTDAVGTHEYEVSVRPQNEGEDANAFNNTRTFSQTVSDDLSVLLIAGDTSAYEEIARLFPDAKIKDYYVPGSVKVPITVEELCEYDEIILSGVNVSAIPGYEMFMESVNTVVSRFGKSLLTIGDTSLQNDTEGKCDVLARMLPVRFGNASDQPKLFTIVIDTSSSMAEGGKFDRAKTAAKRLVDNLNEEDEVAIIFFNGNRGYIQRHTKVGDAAKKAELKAAIDAQWFEHGTDIKLGFETVRDLYDLDFSEKQVMLISDGLDLNIAGSGYEGPLALVDELRANGIYTSVIDIGRLGDSGAAATKAKELLQSIASSAHGGGKHYEMIKDEQLDIAFGEIENDLAETIVEENAFVEVNRVRDGVLDGVDFTANSYVSGFVCNKAVPLATTVLNAVYEKEGGDVKVPIYAYRTLGSGRVASFTSDMGAWTSRGWTQEQRDTFFANVLATNVPQEEVSCPFTVKTDEDGGYVNLEVVPATVPIDAEVEVEVTMPDGQKIENRLTLAATGYYYTFAMPQRGKYEITVRYRYGQYDYAVKCNAHSSFTAEYDSFAVYDAGVLNRMVGTNGTVSLDGKLSLKNDESEVGTYTVSLTVPLLAAAVALFAVDIIVRKLKWEDVVSLFRKVK